MPTSSTTSRDPVVAIVGGTGPEGSGLALRLAVGGYRVLLGSRDPERAAGATRDLRARVADATTRSGGSLEGLRNDAAIAAADVVFICLPYPALDPFLAEWGPLLAGKVVVDVVVPLAFSNGHVGLVDLASPSVSADIQARIPAARIVAAFKNVSAVHLLAVDGPVEGDVLLAGDDADAKRAVATLVRAIPDLRAVDAGPLANAGFLESLTALEISMNRLHKARTGIHILGLE